MANLYKWMFKTACAVLILSNTFNIVMAVFDVSQSVISRSAGLIQGSTAVSPDMLSNLQTTLEGMDLGPLLGLWLQSSVIGLTMQALGIIIFVLVYGRMIEIYLLTSLAPIPVATLSNREVGGMGQNYLKSLFAVGFQGTDAVLQEAVIPIEVSVRPIEPQGKLIGFASVNFGGVVVDDFKVVNGQNGIFLGAPSKPDPTSRTGYRATVRINDRATQERLNAAGVEAYHSAVEKLIARAEAVRPAPIREQMDKAGKEAAQKNAARSAPAKGKEGRDGR